MPSCDRSGQPCERFDGPTGWKTPLICLCVVLMIAMIVGILGGTIAFVLVNR